VKENKFIQFVYQPDYLQNAKFRKTKLIQKKFVKPSD
jgi:hypothetical protein